MYTIAQRRLLWFWRSCDGGAWLDNSGRVVPAPGAAHPAGASRARLGVRARHAGAEVRAAGEWGLRFLANEERLVAAAMTLPSPTYVFVFPSRGTGALFLGIRTLAEEKLGSCRPLRFEEAWRETTVWRGERESERLHVYLANHLGVPWCICVSLCRFFVETPFFEASRQRVVVSDSSFSWESA